MKLEELKEGKYYKATDIGGNLSYIKYEYRHDFSHANVTFIKCSIAIYCDGPIMSYKENFAVQAEIRSGEILASIFPISKTVFYKIIRKYNETRRIEKRKML